MFETAGKHLQNVHQHNNSILPGARDKDRPAVSPVD
jgi:hypothetical protein